MLRGVPQSDAQRAAQKRYRERNREAMCAKSRAYSAEWRARRGPRSASDQEREKNAATHRTRQAVINALKDRPCVGCGGKFHAACMDFDHVRGDKKYGITAGRVVRADFAEELAKCELRCSNCHRLRHALERAC